MKMLKCELSERHVEFDLIKGYAMLLIIWGHVTNALFAGEVVYYFPAKLIGATFVMPIFMWVSGFLACYSLQKRTFVQYIGVRCKRVAVPCVVWNLLTGIGLNLAKLVLHRGPMSSISLGGYWFLWALIICDIALAVQVKFCKHHVQIVLASMAICILLVFLPTERWYLAWVYPFFVLGYFSPCIIQRFKQHFWTVWILAVAIYILILPFFQDEFLVYYSGSSIWQDRGILEQIGIDLYRFVIGLLGCIVMYGLCKMVIDNIGVHNPLIRIVIRLGEHSMGLYVIHTFIVAYILTAVVHNIEIIKKFCQMRRNLTVYVIGPVVVIGVVILVEIVIFIFRKNRLLKGMLLGEYR